MDILYLLEEMQAWPVFLNLEAISPFTAKSTSAESKTMRGAFPPSSRDIFLTVSADRDSKTLPVAVEPVKEIFCTRSLVHKTLPVWAEFFLLDVTTLKTPGGKAA